MSTGKACSVRSMYFPLNEQWRMISVHTTHHRVNNGISVPRVEDWFTVKLTVASRSVMVTSPRDGKRVEFVIFFTKNAILYPPSSSLLDSFPERGAWHGEMLVMRRAQRGGLMVNFRTEDFGLAMTAVNCFLQNNLRPGALNN
ncbi:hypothetical protein BV25DRAFT_1912313 [Artomyces pyxidatus]|uniref:Uncharacterized protein n=1 Tax=Artomyces pyxidatus TaxID=48021 RepID=A0ACB8TF25_9AGAM|nr:hypothetical protein BV25DRAFT_1912313 [Artomyces pyxidatus]